MTFSLRAEQSPLLTTNLPIVLADDVLLSSSCSCVSVCVWLCVGVQGPPGTQQDHRPHTAASSTTNINLCFQHLSNDAPNESTHKRDAYRNRIVDLAICLCFCIFFSVFFFSVRLILLAFGLVLVTKLDFEALWSTSDFDSS